MTPNVYLAVLKPETEESGYAHSGCYQKNTNDYRTIRTVSFLSARSDRRCVICIGLLSEPPLPIVYSASCIVRDKDHLPLSLRPLSVIKIFSTRLNSRKEDIALAHTACAEKKPANCRIIRKMDPTLYWRSDCELCGKALKQRI